MTLSYFEMLRQRQWTEIAQLYDAEALRDFREMMSFLSEIPDEEAVQVLGFFFGPGATKEQVKSMSDVAFFSAILRGALAQAEQLGQLDFRKTEILGSVPEGDSLRHVVTRNHIVMGDVTMESMEVISFKRTENGWCILMQEKMKGMAQQIKRTLESRRH
jgi:hypothetical protein